MSLPGHDAALGASKELIFVKFENWCEKVNNLGKWLKKSSEILGDELEKFRWTTKKSR